MKKILHLILITCIISIICFLSTSANNSSSSSIPKHVDTISSEIYTDSTSYKIDSLTASLLNEVTTYIRFYHKTCPDIIPESLVKYGLQHDIDICFMMSQAKIETVFGKAGIGRASSKKSIFGVMSKRYNSYDDAVDHYIKVLNTYYLSDTRTEQDLLRKFTTKKGARYAANPNYEKELRSAYKSICNKTNIKELQSQISELQVNQDIAYNK